jgi:hypothetical protein
VEGSLNRVALVATLHCLTGCATGEIVGMVIATALSLGNAASIALATILAFSFGYSFTLLPLVRNGVDMRSALGTAFASDTISISIMEIVDNAFILIVPGAIAGRPDRLALLVEPPRRPLPRVLGGVSRQSLADRPGPQARQDEDRGEDRRQGKVRALVLLSPSADQMNGRDDREQYREHEPLVARDLVRPPGERDPRDRQPDDD